MAPRGAASVIAARCNAASAIGAVSRKYWRCKELSGEDEVIVDLLVEALARLGALIRPCSAFVHHDVANAPLQIQQEVALLCNLAQPRPRSADVLPVPPPCRDHCAHEVGDAPLARDQGGQEVEVVVASCFRAQGSLAVDEAFSQAGTGEYGSTAVEDRSVSSGFDLGCLEHPRLEGDPSEQLHHHDGGQGEAAHHHGDDQDEHLEQVDDDAWRLCLANVSVAYKELVAAKEKSAQQVGGEELVSACATNLHRALGTYKLEEAKRRDGG